MVTIIENITEYSKYLQQIQAEVHEFVEYGSRSIYEKRNKDSNQRSQ